MIKKKNYYEILGVDNNSDINEIKKSYKKLALKYHPDKNNGDKEAELKFQEVAEAYAVLTDPEKKRVYDLTGDADGFDLNFSDNFDPFSLFNNIFKSHLNNFANMKYEQNIDINELLGGISSFQIPVKGVKVSVHTFPNDALFGNDNFIQQESLSELFKNIGGGIGIGSHTNNLEGTDNNNLFSKLFAAPPKKHKQFNNKIYSNKKSPLIEKNLKVSFDELFSKKNKRVKIKVTRNKNGELIEKDKIFSVPLYNKYMLFENEGNETKNCSIGDVKINIRVEKRDDLKRINNNDLLYFKVINIEDIYKNLYFDIKLTEKNIIKVKSMPLISNKNLGYLQVIKNKGLPYIENNDEKQGDIYIYYKLNLPKKVEEYNDFILNINKDENDNIEDIDNNDDQYLLAINSKLENLF
jgi:DnaJ-class molecular chaperone